MGSSSEYTKPFMVFMQYFSIVIFIIITTVLVNFNHKMFTRVTGERAKPLWWLFVLFMTPLILLIIFIFGIIFGKIDFLKLFNVLLGKA